MKRILTVLAVLLILSLPLIGVCAQESPCDINVSYSGHVQDIGDVEPVSNGSILGTTGAGRRIEALRVSLDGNRSDVNIQYQAHVANIGWQDAVADGETAGTQGQGLQIEALKIRLLGARADQYDVYYRTHVQDYGWLQWTSNWNNSGTEGLSKRVEAVQIQVVSKGGQVTAPGPADDYNAPFVKAEPQVSNVAISVDMPIMGNSGTSAAQLVNFYNRNAGREFPSYYLQRGVSLEQFAQMYLEECAIENVRADIAFAQAMYETGYLGFGRKVSINQFNFAGLGAAGPTDAGENFAALYGDNANGIRMGIRAQVQHLKAYASTDPLNQACVDGRFNLVSRGCAPTLNGLNNHWAAESTYAAALVNYIRLI